MRTPALILSVFVAISFLFVSLASAQEAPPRDQRLQNQRTLGWTITVDPLTTALGFAHVQIERRTSPNFSVYTGPNFRLYDSIFSSEEEPYRGFGAELGVRFFPFGKAPSGLWLVARGVGARTFTLDPIDRLESFSGYLSGLVGYTWIPFNFLVLSGGVGVQYLRYGVGEYGTEGLLPALHTAVGIAF